MLKKIFLRWKNKLFLRFRYNKLVPKQFPCSYVKSKTEPTDRQPDRRIDSQSNTQTDRSTEVFVQTCCTRLKYGML